MLIPGHILSPAAETLTSHAGDSASPAHPRHGNGRNPYSIPGILGASPAHLRHLLKMTPGFVWLSLWLHDGDVGDVTQLFG